LGKSDAAVGQKQSGLDAADCVFDQGCELVSLIVGDRSAKKLHLDQPLADEDYWATSSIPVIQE
jgi:hypothetical protein